MAALRRSSIAALEKDAAARLLTISLLTLFVGCAPSGANGPAAEVTDSSGVRIVTYDLAAVDAPVLGAVGGHDLEIGVLEGPGEYTFSRIVDLALLSDGSLVVSDAASQELRVFDGDGRHVANIGHPGEGPGEFAAAPALAGVARDTVFAFDARAGRVTSFTRDGRLVESTAIRSGNGNRISDLTRMADGDYLAVSRWTAASPTLEIHDMRLELDSIVIERLDPRGRVVDTVRVMPDRNRARVVQDRGERRIGVIQAEQPHSPRAFLESDGTNVVIGRSDSFTLDVSPLDGSPVRVRVLGMDHPADAARIRSYEEAAYRERTGNPTIDARTRMLFDVLPERLPAFAAVTVSSTGDVWVARAALGDADGHEWLVFTPTGELKGSVRTPPRMRLLAVGPGTLVGVVTDDLDVPFIRRYPLVAPTGP